MIPSTDDGNASKLAIMTAALVLNLIALTPECMSGMEIQIVEVEGQKE